MGLFGKIFSKEACIICGETVGSLKRKRLGDEAIICKDCAEGLSPWFDEYKESTSDSIREQLAAREQNRAQLPNFKVDCSFGKGDALLVDKDKGLFCIVSGAGGASYSSGAQLVDKNPDLIPVSAITSIEVEGVGISHRELKHTVDGEQVSYDPRRYEYPCNPRLLVKLDHPYIRQVSANFSQGTINIQTEGERLRDHDILRIRSAGELTADWLLGRDIRVEDKAGVWLDRSLEGQMDRVYKHFFGDVMDDHPEYAYGLKVSRDNWYRIQELTECMQEAETARALLLKMKDA